MTRPKDNIIHLGGGMSYLTLASAAVKISDSKDVFANPDSQPIVNPKKGYRRIVPWGANNDLPQQIISKVGKSPDMSQNMLFNISAAYGDGILPIRRKIRDNKMTFEPAYDVDEINDFFENNHINPRYLLEQVTDLSWFHMTFPQIILNMDDPDKRKVVELLSLEASFSRWEEMKTDSDLTYPFNTPGTIENHFYFASWGDHTPQDEEITATPVLSFKNPTLDLKRRIGREPYPNLKKNDEKKFRYIIPIEFPTPGRLYYGKPYWFSLIESGWYDFAIMIPEFKKALLNNQMTIKYMIYISTEYFPQIFREENITTKEAQTARVKQEYKNLQDFLANVKNTGKATISYIKYTIDGKEQPMVKILPIENHFKGGEYIEDSEEASNILAYGMGIHSSLIGSHGKSKTINGSEARELFIIKQALLKPVRDILLQPFYVIKAINNWPKDIYFTIPNLELTTLDQNTGAKKGIGAPAIPEAV